MSDPVDRDRLAADWIGYALRMAEADRRRHGGTVDWEQAAIDGLESAVRLFRPIYPGQTFSVAYVRRHYRSATTLRCHRRRVDKIERLGRPRFIRLALDRPGREADPAVIAELNEEIESGGSAP